MKAAMEQTRKAIGENSPLVHAITNPISINDCANAILVVGARPVMAEHPAEVTAIAGGADALLLNLGNITDVRMRSMPTAAKAIRAAGRPTVLDAVGVGCSGLRLGIAQRLITEFRPEVVKGNASEILALLTGKRTARGVDVENRHMEEGVDVVARLARKAAQTLQCCVLVSGQRDAVADESGVFTVRGGSQMLANVAGTGCIQGCLAAAFVTYATPLNAALLACAMMKSASMSAIKSSRGPSSFRTALLDELANLDNETLWMNAAIERWEK